MKKLISSHPETTFPDENIRLPAIIYGQKPLKKGFPARHGNLHELKQKTRTG